jgi:hypothetical protein
MLNKLYKCHQSKKIMQNGKNEAWQDKAAWGME